MIAVWSPDAARAIAELPRSVRRSDAPAGAVAVLEGAVGWAESARAALAEGARAVAIAHPAPPAAEELDALAELAARTGAPVVVRRRAAVLLHAPGVRDEVGDPVAVVLECAGGAPALSAAVTEATGIARELGGGDPRLERRVAGARSVFATVAGSTGSASLVVDRITGSAPALLRATVLGRAARVELEFDDAAGTARLALATATGVTLAPAGFEDPARQALRQALAVLSDPGGGEGWPLGGDHGLDAFRRDAALARALLDG